MTTRSNTNNCEDFDFSSGSISVLLVFNDSNFHHRYIKFRSSVESFPHFSLAIFNLTGAALWAVTANVYYFYNIFGTFHVLTNVSAFFLVVCGFVYNYLNRSEVISRSSFVSFIAAHLGHFIILSCPAQFGLFLNARFLQGSCDEKPEYYRYPQNWTSYCITETQPPEVDIFVMCVYMAVYAVLIKVSSPIYSIMSWGIGLIILLLLHYQYSRIYNFIIALALYPVLLVFIYVYELHTMHQFVANCKKSQLSAQRTQSSFDDIFNLVEINNERVADDYLQAIKRVHNSAYFAAAEDTTTEYHSINERSPSRPVNTEEELSGENLSSDAAIFDSYLLRYSGDLGLVDDRTALRRIPETAPGGAPRGAFVDLEDESSSWDDFVIKYAGGLLDGRSNASDDSDSYHGTPAVMFRSSSAQFGYYHGLSERHLNHGLSKGHLSDHGLSERHLAESAPLQPEEASSMKAPDEMVILKKDFVGDYKKGLSSYSDGISDITDETQ